MPAFLGLEFNKKGAIEANINIVESSANPGIPLRLILAIG